MSGDHSSPPNGIHFLLGELKGGLNALKETVEASSRRSTEHHTKLFERVDGLSERVAAVEKEAQSINGVSKKVEEIKERVDKIHTDRRVDTAKRIGVVSGVALTISIIGNAIWQKTAGAATAIINKILN